MKPALFVVFLVTACGTAADERDFPHAPRAVATRVDSVFADITARGPGCAVGVFRDGKLSLSRSYGVANVEDQRRLTPTTTFDLGSAAKPFTALTVLMLEQQGRLSLDDDVRRYVPELPDYGTPIRIRDLIQHTSGLRDYGALELLRGHSVETTQELLTLLSRQRELNFTPGTRHEYSHSDFETLALVVERVVKEPFGAFVERETLSPLGLTNSRINDSRGVPLVERAYGHAPTEGGYRMMFNTSRVAGGGNLYTSIADLLQWDRALAESTTGRRPLIARMLTRPTLPSGDTIPYAYGIRLGKYRGLSTISRGGHTHGTRTEIIRFPEHRLAVATLCNGDHLLAGQRALRVADVFLDSVMQPRPSASSGKASPDAPLTNAELQRYAGVYRSSESLEHSRIAIVDGKLVELFGDTAQTFTYRGDGVFSGDGIPGDFRLAFSQGPAGTMQMAYVSSGETDLAWERMPDAAVWRPDSAELARYAGTYFSEELGAVWQLAVRNGALALVVPGARNGPLIPVQPNVFTRHFGVWNEPLVVRFEFARDAANVVTQFTITTPPGEDVVRGLRFVRSRH